MVRLLQTEEEALARLGGRHRFITDDELRWTYRAEAADPPHADADLEVAALSADEQAAALERLWRAARSHP